MSGWTRRKVKGGWYANVEGVECIGEWIIENESGYVVALVGGKGVGDAAREIVENADAAELAEDVYKTVRRHSHQGRPNVYAYQGHDVEHEPCPLCLALINAGVLTETRGEVKE